MSAKLHQYPSRFSKTEKVSETFSKIKFWILVTNHCRVSIHMCTYVITAPIVCMPNMILAYLSIRMCQQAFHYVLNRFTKSTLYIVMYSCTLLLVLHCVRYVYYAHRTERSSDLYTLEFMFDSDVNCRFTIYTRVPDTVELEALRNG